VTTNSPPAFNLALAEQELNRICAQQVKTTFLGQFPVPPIRLSHWADPPTCKVFCNGSTSTAHYHPDSNSICIVDVWLESALRKLWPKELAGYSLEKRLADTEYQTIHHELVHAYMRFEGLVVTGEDIHGPLFQRIEKGGTLPFVRERIAAKASGKPFIMPTPAPPVKPVPKIKPEAKEAVKMKSSPEQNHFWAMPLVKLLFGRPNDDKTFQLWFNLIVGTLALSALGCTAWWFLLDSGILMYLWEGTKTPASSSTYATGFGYIILIAACIAVYLSYEQFRKQEKLDKLNTEVDDELRRLRDNRKTAEKK
jgi:hypothetical protein